MQLNNFKQFNKECLAERTRQHHGIYFLRNVILKGEVLIVLPTKWNGRKN